MSAENETKVIVHGPKEEFPESFYPSELEQGFIERALQESGPDETVSTLPWKQEDGIEINVRHKNWKILQVGVLIDKAKEKSSLP